MWQPQIGNKWQPYLRDSPDRFRQITAGKDNWKKEEEEEEEEEEKELLMGFPIDYNDGVMARKSIAAFHHWSKMASVKWVGRQQMIISLLFSIIFTRLWLCLAAGSFPKYSLCFVCPIRRGEKNLAANLFNNNRKKERRKEKNEPFNGFDLKNKSPG